MMVNPEKTRKTKRKKKKIYLKMFEAFYFRTNTKSRNLKVDLSFYQLNELA